VRGLDLACSVFVAGLSALLNPLAIELELILIGIPAFIDRHRFHLHLLFLLRELPERLIENPHRNTRLGTESSAIHHVIPPEFKGIELYSLLYPDRPESGREI
jgi:hypothetical protein